MPKYNGVVISDVHVGAFDLNRMRREFSELFIENIKNMKSLDFVIVDGDFFDHKFYLGDKEAVVAHAMLQELIDVCKTKNSELRFVYGTESHECSQYDVMKVLKTYEKIKVIKYVTEEELLPGLNILYLPEEYIFDKSEYYKEYFNNINKYDYIFGHGVVREVMKDIAAKMEANTDKRKKVPVFNSVELSKICKGETYFGHYHIGMNIDDKIFSVGSYSRWKFGEEQEKGYYELKVDTDKEKYSHKFIENTLTDKYVTITYGYDSKIFKSEKDMEAGLNSVDKLIKNDSLDNVRFIFNIPKDIENPEATINLIKEKYKFNNKVKTEITHGYIEEKKKQQKEKIETENSNYSFIFNEDLPITEKSQLFISLEYSKEIPVENIDKYLYKTLKEILE